MPRIRRENIPRPLMAHLLLRIQEREIGSEQLAELAEWLDSDPEVPLGEMVQKVYRNDNLWRRESNKNISPPRPGSRWRRARASLRSFPTLK